MWVMPIRPAVLLLQLLLNQQCMIETRQPNIHPPDTLQVSYTGAAYFSGLRIGYTRNYSSFATAPDLFALEVEIGYYNNIFSAELLTGFNYYGNVLTSGDMPSSEFGGYSYFGLQAHLIDTRSKISPYIGGGFAFCHDENNYLSATANHYPLLNASIGLLGRSYRSLNFNANLRTSFIFTPHGVSPDMRLLIGFTTPMVRIIESKGVDAGQCLTGCAGCTNAACILIIVIGGLAVILSN